MSNLKNAENRKDSMGVIHKLKPEVVEFIVQHKKDNPTVGCRKLADLTSDKFNIKVSKSSINTILKNSQLSSPVGRRTVGGKKEKKFRIPQEKKKQLFDSFSKNTVNNENLKTSPEKPSVELKKKEQSKDSTPVVTPASPASKGGVDAERKDIPDGKDDKKFDLKKKTVSQSKTPKIEEEIKGVGLIFLKAALCELMESLFVSDVLKRIIREQKGVDFNRYCEALMYGHILGDQYMPEVLESQSHGLCLLSGLKKSEDIFSAKDWARTQFLPKSFLIEYLTEKERVFVEVAAIKLVLKDSTEIFMDARMTCVLKHKPADGFSSSFHKAMEALSRQIISHNEPIVISYSGISTSMDHAFIEFIAACEDLPEKHIAKVLLLSPEGFTLAEFDMIPDIKRKFMTSIMPQQEEFEDLIKVSQNKQKKEVYYQELDKKIEFVESETAFATVELLNGVQESFKVITLWENGSAEPAMAILTNERDQSAEESVLYFLSQRPNLQNSSLLAHKEMINEEKPAAFSNFGGRHLTELGDYHQINLSDILSDLGVAVQEYCQRHFFPVEIFNSDKNLLDSMVYNISGSLTKTNQNCIAELCVPEGFCDAQALQFAIDRINNANICDFEGHRIIIK